MSNLIVRAAIEGRLKTWAAAYTPVLPVTLQNEGYVPSNGTAYIRGTLMPAETKHLGRSGQHKQYHGMYQVSIYFPDGEGWGEAEAAAKAIEVLFEAPTTIVKSARNVNITRTPAIASGAPDGSGFFMVPVTIWYEMQDF